MPLLLRCLLSRFLAMLCIVEVANAAPAVLDHTPALSRGQEPSWKDRTQLLIRSARPTATWHLDKMVATIQGRRMYLWRAVDSESEILEVPVHPRRDKASALTLGALAPMTDAFVPIHSLAFSRLSFAPALSWQAVTEMPPSLVRTRE
jgi:hypothetical protein